MKNKSLMVFLLLLTVSVLFYTGCRTRSLYESMEEAAREEIYKPVDSSEILVRPHLVPVRDNKALIRGKILDVDVFVPSHSSSQTQRKVYKYTLLIQASYDVEGFKNFVSEKVGEQLTVYSHELPSAEVLDSYEIEAFIIYRGDERSRSFWIQDINVIK